MSMVVCGFSVCIVVIVLGLLLLNRWCRFLLDILIRLVRVVIFLSVGWYVVVIRFW